MKKNIIHRALLAVVPLCVWACAQSPTVPMTAASARLPVPQLLTWADAEKVIGTLPPDVSTTCSAAVGSMKFTALHPAESADQIHACLASHDLSAALRVFMLQGMVMSELDLKDFGAAVDSQRAIIDLESVPRDAQLLLLAVLYENTHQFQQGMAVMEQLRAGHDAAHDQDAKLGPIYYLAD